MVKTRESAKQRKRRTKRAKTNEPRDELLEVALEQYGNILMMYDMFEDKRPVMLRAATNSCLNRFSARWPRWR
jgi:hypothetical protein